MDSWKGVDMSCYVVLASLEPYFVSSSGTVLGGVSVKVGSLSIVSNSANRS